jgi:hypothetical protein
MANTGNPPTNPPGSNLDILFINELHEEIEQNWPGIEARKLLVQYCTENELLDAAAGAALELQQLVPHDADVKQWCRDLGLHLAQPPPPSSNSAHKAASTPEHSGAAEAELAHGYVALRSRAQSLLRLSQNLRQQKEVTAHCDKHIPVLAALADGRISSAIRARPPGSVRAVARSMEANPNRALDIAVIDLTDMARWLKSPKSGSFPLDNDAAREALAKRMHALIAALPNKLQLHASSALMHVEHEVLNRTYVCNETMYGDPVANISREHFWVSEDGYAWDMEELAQALVSNGGVMRNPLNRQLFTPDDIRAILQHPLGKRLAALQIEQEKMLQGIRPKTIKKLDTLATAFLDDMDDDQVSSRHAVDEFLAYVATLPRAEQEAIDSLRVPAKDSHTNQPFDTSIGEAVRDAQGNRLCFHKAGDLLRQAVKHLRQKG